jgi:hypothetical protein
VRYLSIKETNLIGGVLSAERIMALFALQGIKQGLKIRRRFGKKADG